MSVAAGEIGDGTAPATDDAVLAGDDVPGRVERGLHGGVRRRGRIPADRLAKAAVVADRDARSLFELQHGSNISRPRKTA